MFTTISNIEEFDNFVMSVGNSIESIKESLSQLVAPDLSKFDHCETIYKLGQMKCQEGGLTVNGALNKARDEYLTVIDAAFNEAGFVNVNRAGGYNTNGQ